MNFYVVDIFLLILFTTFVLIFLYINRKRIDREGVIFIYRTKWGISFIEKLSKKNKRVLSFFSYLSIIFGYFFMFFSIIFLIYSLKIMILAKYLPKVPPIMPILPYVTTIFKITFLPPLYFTYWIIILLVIALSHEFAHGIFAKFFGINLKSTGFGFFGPFMVAFVEPDEKKMKKKKIRQQLAILSAGSFANFLVAIIFIAILQLFLFVFFSPTGIHGYFFAGENINLSLVSSFGNYSLKALFNNSNISFPIKVYTHNRTYFLTEDLWSAQKQAILENKTNQIFLYLDSPAFRANLTGAIIAINGRKVNSINDILSILKDKKPGDKLYIITENKNYSIILSENPKNNSKGFLGISFVKLPFVTRFFSFNFYKFNPYLKIKPNINIGIAKFIIDLFYWLIIIAMSVALFNMLPFSFLDGGRVAYMSFLYLFKNEKKSKLLYYIFNLFVLITILLMFLIWLFKI